MDWSSSLDDRGRRWLHQEMSRLSGVCRLRCLSEEPPQGTGGLATFSLLGQERHFHDKSTFGAVFRLMESELCLDDAAWRYQEWFLSNLFRCFFRDSNDPA
jgi:hypothetical protein